MVIDDFHGDNFFLSNFYPYPVEFEGLTYPSNEHAYQAAKTLDLDKRKEFTNPNVSAGQSKKMGRTVKLREDWDSVKLGVMKQLLVRKFSDKELRKKLNDTGDCELVEGNYWNDTYWGVCKGVGENHLGKLLMEIRSYNRLMDGTVQYKAI